MKDSLKDNSTRSLQIFRKNPKLAMCSETTPLCAPQIPKATEMEAQEPCQQRDLRALLSKVYGRLSDAITNAKADIALLCILTQTHCVQVAPYALISFLLCLALRLLPLLQTYVGPLYSLAVYLIVTTVLEGIGQLLWLSVSFSVENRAHATAWRRFENVTHDMSSACNDEKPESTFTARDKQSIAEWESNLTLGQHHLLQTLPTLIALIWVSFTDTLAVTIFAVALPVSVYGLKKVIEQWWKVSTGKEMLDAKDEKNDLIFSPDREAYQKSQTKYQSTRLSRVVGSLGRKLIWGSIIFFLIVFKQFSTRLDLSDGAFVVLGMFIKDILSLDTHLAKLDKS
ncbi:hypothetical protein BX600DRAFT_469788 [Xylariales sp. PMI_506]|nr:hypothetical protein BX600DRAFT_469788 [Xylariales sp. PMI_506]